MLLIRKIHTYLGLLIAPSVLFFAFTGTLQLFSLHEAHGPYHPPAILRTLGDVHKDQVLSEPKHDDGPAAGAAPSGEGEVRHAGPSVPDDDQPQVKTYLLKWFFALAAVGLLVSTGMGLWIGLRFTRTPLLSWGLLLAGAAIPVLLLIL